MTDYTPTSGRHGKRQDQEIWNIVGDVPVIISLLNVRDIYSEWYRTAAELDGYFTLNTLLRDSEIATYDRLAKKEDRPSKIIAAEAERTGEPEIDTCDNENEFSNAMTWSAPYDEENIPDPTRI